MQILSMEAYLEQAIEVLARSPLLHGLDRESLEAVAENGELLRFDHDEALARQGDDSDSFLLLVEGEATVVLDGDDDAPVTLAHISPPDSIGEMGVLLEQPRSASVYANGGAIALRFSASRFHAMLLRHPYFGLVMCRTLASRLHDATRRIPLPELGDLVTEPDAEALALLPVEFQIRHRVVPLDVRGDAVRLGCVDDVDPDVLDRVRRLLPGMAVRVLRVSADYFESTMRASAGTGWFEAVETSALPAYDAPPGRELDLGTSPLEGVLRSMIGEGATELHLVPGRAPRWRIDGQLRALRDETVLGADDPFEMVLALVPRPAELAGFEHAPAFELTHEIPDVARFRIRLSRDLQGTSIIVWPVPFRVPGPAQLGLPEALVELTARDRGLVIVAGPRGAGSSTSLAALVGHIARTKPALVVTLEDPVEYVFDGGQAVVKQREIGRHVPDLAAGLDGARRDHAEVVVVPDLRDAGAVPAALDLASTGALVLVGVDADGTVDAVERVLAMAEPERRAALTRTLSRCLLGVSSQVLARRVGGGQVAAFEVLEVPPSAAKYLAEGRMDRLAHQRTTTMAQALAARVEKGEITADEARRLAPDLAELDRALAKG